MLAYLRAQPCCSSYERAVTHLEAKFVQLGAVGVACLVIMLASLYCVVRIVTVPIVMKSMLTVINGIFLLLGVGPSCAGSVSLSLSLSLDPEPVSLASCVHLCVQLTSVPSAVQASLYADCR